MPKSSSKKQPKVSKPVALIVVLTFAAVVVLVIVGLIRAVIGPGYKEYEGQCAPSSLSENERDYGDMFIDCSDPEAHWEITDVYTSEPSRADWSSTASARRWLERECDVNDEDGPARRALVFSLKNENGFLACAVAVE